MAAPKKYFGTPAELQARLRVAARKRAAAPHRIAAKAAYNKARGPYYLAPAIRAKRRAASWKRQGIVPTRPEPAHCEACARPSTASYPLRADHCHLSNVFRGWLCNNCNVGLGLIGDDIRGLVLLVRYLERLL